MADRRQLRQEILGRRDTLPEDLREGKSSLIRSRLLEMHSLNGASRVMIYINYRSEVITRPLIIELKLKGITVAAPLTVPEDYDLVPYRIEDEVEDLFPGYRSIPEPDVDRCLQFDPAALDVILVPGAVFDPSGGRLGYGGGYYDRFLSRMAPEALTVGLAYELQVVPEIPLQEHDVPLDWIVTEERMIKGSRKSGICPF